MKIFISIPGIKNPFAFRQMPRHTQTPSLSLLGQNPGAAWLQSDCKDTVNS